MFFYLSLFIACVVTAVVFLYLYHALVDVGQAVYRAFLPSAKKKFVSRPVRQSLATTINDTPTPWGWHDNVSPEAAARTRSVAPAGPVPWGWRGGNYESTGHGVSAGEAGAAHTAASEKGSRSVGWPYREEKSELAGKSYKVSRRVTLKRTNLASTGKPWGW